VEEEVCVGREGKWEYEIGEDMRPVNLDVENISESRGNVSTNAFFSSAFSTFFQ